MQLHKEPADSAHPLKVTPVMAHKGMQAETMKATEATRVRMRRRPKWPAHVLKHRDPVPRVLLNECEYSFSNHERRDVTENETT